MSGRSIWCWRELEDLGSVMDRGGDTTGKDSTVQKVGVAPPGLRFDKSFAVGERSPNSCCMVSVWPT